ncbi:PAS domain-containing protein [Actinomycetaceae bacterium WB03_NA08]|uniref:PAS domain-containing protein n=1 Tax=Scrofimicrobium canadense TaxID=2652290 RepID=A0A6N7W8U2_9ACTO|nr:PAS domain-containing protein [Scrofimicrobium canadense]MSS84913.1 PAS domain-containing protein [Scrofimicrobium canadense]
MTELRFPDGGQTDVERIVGIRQIFFSTTDRKGVITGANQTFADLSQYSFPELMGAPHNIIRHDDMPGGVFQIMWDRLLDGKSVAAYVKNRAKDGRFYWVFATVTPASSSFLSVRTRPVYEPLWQASDTLYRTARPIEVAATRQGARRIDAARVGMASLNDGLAQAGFPSFDEFMLAALPAEVAQRELLSTSPTINVDSQSPLSAIVGGAQAIRVHVNALLERLVSLNQVSSQIRETLAGAEVAQKNLLRLAGMAVETCQSIPGLPPSIVNSALAIREWVFRAVSALEAIEEPLSDVSLRIREARFDICLNSLHNEMVLSFANEALTTTSDANPLGSVPLLCHTMMGDVEGLAGKLDVLQRELINVGNRTDEANGALQHVREFLAAWQMAVARKGYDQQLAQIIEDIEDQQDNLHGQVQSLTQLAASFFTALQGVNPSALMEPIPVVAYGALSLVGDASVVGR